MLGVGLCSALHRPAQTKKKKLEEKFAMRLNPALARRLNPRWRCEVLLLVQCTAHATASLFFIVTARSRFVYTKITSYFATVCIRLQHAEGSVEMGGLYRLEL